MTMKHNLAIAGSAILLSFAHSASASAADWTHKSLTSDLNSPHEQLFSAASDSTALTFICMDRKLRAAIATHNTEAADIISAYAETRRRIDRNVNLMIGGETVDSPRWKINPAQKIMVTPNRSTTLKLYNAIIGQDKISVGQKGKTQYDLTLPEPNEAFAKFGANCGVGTLKEAS